MLGFWVCCFLACFGKKRWKVKVVIMVKVFKPKEVIRLSIKFRKRRQILFLGALQNTFEAP